MKIYPLKSQKKLLEFLPPSSKSQTMRALIFASLANGKSTIYDYLDSSDTHAMIKTLRSLGVNIELFKEHLNVHGVGSLFKPTQIIDAQNSGIILRFISGICALTNNTYTITGDHSIKKNRVITPLLDGLNQLGALAKSCNDDDHPPILIRGPIKSGKIVVSGEDSQPISALLIATAFANGLSEIFVKNPGELPWVQLTLDWFDLLNIKYENHNFSHYKVYGNSKIEEFEKRIEKDFSSIYYLIASALITRSSIKINSIDFKTSGADKDLIYILQKMGADIQIDPINKSLEIKKFTHLIPLEIDVNPFIDCLPILAVLACFIEGKTTLFNAKIARFKESDRIHTICQELKKMGALIEEKEDGLIIQKSDLKGADLFSHGDHRIALSLCVAALGAKGVSTIENSSCIDKSYPYFFEDLKKMGVQIE